MNYPFGVLRSQFQEPVKEQMHWLPTITKPVLLLHGDADLMTPLAISQYLLKTFPNARLHILKNRGHCLAFTAAEEMGSVIRGFLREDQEDTAPR